MLTVEEAASRVGRSPETVRRWIRSGRLNATTEGAGASSTPLISTPPLLGCRLVTLDARLRRGTVRLGFLIGPTEL